MRTKAFDNYIRSYRKRSGLTQDELSFLLGSKSGTRISRYELGRREPSLELLLALEAIFGVSVGELYRTRLSKVEESVRERAGKLLMALEGAPRRNHARSILAAIYSNNAKQV